MLRLSSFRCLLTQSRNANIAGGQLDWRHAGINALHLLGSSFGIVVGEKILVVVAGIDFSTSE